MRYSVTHLGWKVLILTLMPNASVWKSTREDLRRKRCPRIGDFEKCPSDVLLALKPKAIDDEIAVCTEHIEKENRIG
jgi:hypothetical protein